MPQGSGSEHCQLYRDADQRERGRQRDLSWDVSNASYVIVSPQAGAVRGTSVTVQPGQTTTYKLYATNQYGRTTATVTVTVP